MFQHIQRRLLLYQLTIPVGILVLFAVLVRLFFSQSLLSRLNDELTLVGEGIIDDAQQNHTLFRATEIDIGLLEQARQNVVWYAPSGKPLSHLGLPLPILPIQNRHRAQFLVRHPQLASVQLPIFDSRKHLEGYLAVSQSLEEHFNQPMQRLDLGLMGGIACALVLSGWGSLWLTRQAMRPIEDSFNRLQQFTADASHELRSPLTAIASNAAVALKYSDGMRPSDHRKLTAIANAADQINRLTDDLLFLARTGTVPASQLESVSLAELATEVVHYLKPEAIPKGIRLERQGMEVEVRGNPLLLRRLIVNLLENAIAYSPAGTSITLSTEPVGPRAVLIVADQGIGIAPEDLPHIFQRFWRANPARSHREGGSGLGLSIVQEIVRLHQGNIQVTSKLNVGTTIRVDLPLQD